MLKMVYGISGPYVVAKNICDWRGCEGAGVFRNSSSDYAGICRKLLRTNIAVIRSWKNEFIIGIRSEHRVLHIVDRLELPLTIFDIGQCNSDLNEQLLSDLVAELDWSSIEVPDGFNMSPLHVFDSVFPLQNDNQKLGAVNEMGIVSIASVRKSRSVRTAVFESSIFGERTATAFQIM